MDIANFKLQIAKVVRDRIQNVESRIQKGGGFWILNTGYWLPAILPFAFLLLSGCVSFQTLGEVQHGRRELLYGDPKVAQVHFQRAAELDPDYLLNNTVFPEGVWTYVGRAYYAAGRFSDARNALERARSRYADDYLAQIYLGLVLGRDGDPQRGLREITSGLKGLEAWFDYLDRYHPQAPYWDPGRQIRAEIQRSLAMVSGKEFNWQELIANGEWLGRAMEEEIDLAERQRWFEEEHDVDGDDGNPN